MVVPWDNPILTLTKKLEWDMGIVQPVCIGGIKGDIVSEGRPVR